MAKALPETIMIKGDSWVTHEANASVALTPGELVTFDSNGDFALPSAGDTLFMVVIEDDLQGKEITEDYDANNNCRAIVPQPGSLIYAVLADAQNVPIGRELEIDAAGHLITIGSNEEVAIAMEAVNSSDSATTPLGSRRIKVLVL